MSKKTGLVRQVTQDGLMDGFAAVSHLVPWDNKAFRRFYETVYFSYKRHVEDPFHALVQARPDLFTAGHIVDVGANVGYHAVLFASALASHRKVFAFEPEARNFDLMREILERRSLGEAVSAHCVALGAKDETGSLRVSPTSPSDHRIAPVGQGDASVPVSIRRLDTFLPELGISPEDVGFVKVDVQGFELEVCRGMERLLRSPKLKAVALELDREALAEHGASPEDLLAVMAESGLTRCFHLTKTGPIAVEDPESWVRSAPSLYYDLLFTRD